MGGWLGVSILFLFILLPDESSLPTCISIIFLVTGQSCVCFRCKCLFFFFFNLSLYFFLDELYDRGWRIVV